MPFERTGELEHERLDLGVAEAWVEDECLHVSRKAKRAGDMRFDVVVQAVALIRGGEVEETHSRRRTERRRVEAGIGIPECAARRDPRSQPQVGGTEPRNRTAESLRSCDEGAPARSCTGQTPVPPNHAGSHCTHRITGRPPSMTSADHVS